MTFNILFVCSANVCRSPLAATLMSDYLRKRDTHAQIVVSSAGVHAARGAERCATSTAWLKKHDHDVPPHRSRRAVRGVTQDADLVLVTDRGVRSALLQSDPLVRPRTFTIREAVVLGRSASSRTLARRQADSELISDVTNGDRVPPLGTVDLLTGWVEEMNASRGLIPLGVPERPHWYRRNRVSSPFDIPDAHGGDQSWGHRPVLSLTQQAVEGVSSAMALVTDDAHS